MTSLRENVAREIKAAVARSSKVLSGDVFDKGDPLGLAQDGYYDAADKAIALAREAAFEEAARKVAAFGPYDPGYQALATAIRNLTNEPWT
jgi:hypothetical protein